jgi:hypothetical protein
MTTNLNTPFIDSHSIYQRLCALGNALVNYFPEELPPVLSKEEERKIMKYHIEIDPELTLKAHHLNVDYEAICPLEILANNSSGYSESVINSRHDRATARKLDFAFDLYTDDQEEGKIDDAFVVYNEDEDL